MEASRGCGSRTGLAQRGEILNMGTAVGEDTAGSSASWQAQCVKEAGRSWGCGHVGARMPAEAGWENTGCVGNTVHITQPACPGLSEKPRD